MQKYLVLWLAISGLLAGCAGLTGDEAPVEDRMGSGARSGTRVEIVESGASGSTAVGAQQANITDAKPAGGTSGTPGMSTQGLRSTNISESGQAAGGRGTTGGMETMGMPAQQGAGAQTQSAAAGGAANQAGAGAGVAPHGGGKGDASSTGLGMDLNSPGSILSKRIIYFDYDSSAIRDEFRDLLEAHAAYLKAQKDSKVLLQGHADERGSREYNLALGQRRAEGVLQAFALLGVDLAQMEAVSLGEEKPVDEGHDEAAWSQNRRTEIVYQGE